MRATHIQRLLYLPKTKVLTQLLQCIGVASKSSHYTTVADVSNVVDEGGFAPPSPKAPGYSRLDSLMSAHPDIRDTLQTREEETHSCPQTYERFQRGIRCSRYQRGTL